MSVSVHAVANKFIELAENNGAALTNMQLQKLVFLSQGFTLGLLGRPLYHQDTFAWQFGPVVKDLYKSLQKYGRNEVTELLPEAGPTDFGDDEIEIMEAVWQTYGKLSGIELSEITHEPGTPWSQTWAEHQFSVIPQQLIAAYYQQLATAS